MELEPAGHDRELAKWGTVLPRQTINAITRAAKESGTTISDFATTALDRAAMEVSPPVLSLFCNANPRVVIGQIDNDPIDDDLRAISLLAEHWQSGQFHVVPGSESLISRDSSDEELAAELYCNLVIVGGPKHNNGTRWLQESFAPDEYHFALCTCAHQSKSRCKVPWHLVRNLEKGEFLHAEGSQNHNAIERDWGIIRLQNHPLVPGAKILLLAGVDAGGTLASVRAACSLPFVASLLKQWQGEAQPGKQLPDFECLVAVSIVNGTPQPTRPWPRSARRLKTQKPPAEAAPPEEFTKTSEQPEDQANQRVLAVT